MDGETGRALPRARVRISGPGIQRPSVLTDEQGVFTFAGLPAGSFFVNADKPTYMYGSPGGRAYDPHGVRGANWCSATAKLATTS